MSPDLSDGIIPFRADAVNRCVADWRPGWYNWAMNVKGVTAVVVLLCCGLFAEERRSDRPGPLEVLREVAAAVIGVGGNMLRAGDFEGPVRAREARFRFLTVQDVEGRLSRKGTRWEVHIEKGKLAGGVLSGTVVIAWDEEERSIVELDLSIDGADLAEITRAADIREYKGKVRGRVKLSVRGGELAGLAGEGSLYVTDAKLAGVPMVAKVLGIMGAPSLRQTSITSAEAHFTLTPRAVVFQALEFKAGDDSLALQAERNGVARYDGTLALVILPVVDARILAGLKLAEELASEVLRALERRVMRVNVEGSVSEPQITWSPTR